MIDLINTENLEWYIFADGKDEAKTISQTMQEMNIDQETQCLEIASGSICNIFRINEHLAKLIISTRELKEYQLYAKEKDCKVAFPVGPQSAKALIGNIHLGKHNPSYKKLADTIGRAKHMYDAKRVVEMTALKEMSASKKGQRTFKIYDLVESYEEEKPKLMDLVGFDKVVHDYLCQKSYVLRVEKRKGKYQLIAVSYPAVHTAHELRSIPFPE